MSSYNHIEKIKYIKNPSDVVALHEYIVFEDDKAEAKFVVFKFLNNLNQRLHALNFEVLQFNEEGELLEKSVVVHDDLLAEPNASFVPNAKLRVNFACKSLQVNLISAAFDRVKWEKGEFSDNSYPFDEYAKKAAQETEKKQTKPAAQAVSEPEKKLKNGFAMKNVFRKNVAVFPKVFLWLTCIALVAFVIVTLVLFRRSSPKLYIDGFDLEEVSEDTVNICGYDGTDTELTIPAKLGKYTLHKITENAFENSNIKRIVLNTENIVIEKNAFANCKSLETVESAVGCGEIVVMEYAFANCTKLATFSMSTAQLMKNSLSGCMNVSTLSFHCYAVRDSFPLIELFSTEDAAKKEIALLKIGMTIDLEYEEFFQNVIVRDLQIIE